MTTDERACVQFLEELQALLDVGVLECDEASEEAIRLRPTRFGRALRALDQLDDSRQSDRSAAPAP
jgi:hypothetical protein